MPVPLIAMTSQLCDVTASLTAPDREEQWEEHFKRLDNFSKGKWGDTNIVVENHMGAVGLWAWARNQTTAFKSGILGCERAE